MNPINNIQINTNYYSFIKFNKNPAIMTTIKYLLL